MAKISAYPDGGVLVPSTDTLIIKRSGKNYQITPHGVLQFCTAVRMVDSAANTWNGFAATIGTYTFDLQDANHNLPSGISAILLTASGRWGAAATANYCAFYPNGGTGGLAYGAFRAMVANINTDIQLVCAVGTNDDIQVVVAGANMVAATLTLLGYYT